MNIAALYLIVSVPYIIFAIIGIVMMLRNFSNPQATIFWKKSLFAANVLFFSLNMILAKLSGIGVSSWTLLLVGLALYLGWRATYKRPIPINEKSLGK